jgi:hypothetical protein
MLLISCMSFRADGLKSEQGCAQMPLEGPAEPPVRVQLLAVDEREEIHEQATGCRDVLGGECCHVLVVSHGGAQVVESEPALTRRTPVPPYRRGMSTPYPFTGPRRRLPPAPTLADHLDLRVRRMVDEAGVVRQVVPIGELARCLEKSCQTVRRWERSRVLPKCAFRQRLKNGSTRRWYLAAWVEGIVQLALEEDVAPGKTARFEGTQFTARALVLRDQLLQ